MDAYVDYKASRQAALPGPVIKIGSPHTHHIVQSPRGLARTAIDGCRHRRAVEGTVRDIPPAPPRRTSPQHTTKTQFPNILSRSRYQFISVLHSSSVSRALCGQAPAAACRRTTRTSASGGRSCHLLFSGMQPYAQVAQQRGTAECRRQPLAAPPQLVARSQVGARRQRAAGGSTARYKPMPGIAVRSTHAGLAAQLGPTGAHLAVAVAIRTGRWRPPPLRICWW